ncbi:Two-component response regulator [Methylophaga frappieri]|uniref:Two-component response regulator n=1 Tax=Methylophaga frappieri (strain ATCC BAA-2434 / DSM 25690 / JAM7) TaxID=754477 RepID=I1YJC0_METFJ|nr:response regulator transcription factor [Methylophaga frappieri]AFJ03013.1 Two-component response regulator [Methylophaga frappieri]
MAESVLNTVVLVVDDTPDTLAFLHDALDESGYTVLVADNGESALEISRNASPDIVLLDALMPGMDGFEVCRALKQDLSTRHIPVIFMTGLTESEHVVSGFSAGGIDYVTKPLSPVEVIARINTHLKNSRLINQTQGALDAFGQAAIAVYPKTGKVIWQTPLARQLINTYCPSDDALNNQETPAQLQTWLDSLKQGGEQRLRSFIINNPNGRLIFNPADLQSEDQWLILLREESETAQIEALRALFSLTKRESEVLHWVILGKTDKSIGEILGTSPRTINKHMEHVFTKLGVETRTAAASLAVNKLRTVSGNNQRPS